MLYILFIPFKSFLLFKQFLCMYFYYVCIYSFLFQTLFNSCPYFGFIKQCHYCITQLFSVPLLSSVHIVLKVIYGPRGKNREGDINILYQDILNNRYYFIIILFESRIQRPSQTQRFYKHCFNLPRRDQVILVLFFCNFSSTIPILLPLVLGNLLAIFIFYKLNND